MSNKKKVVKKKGLPAYPTHKSQMRKVKIGVSTTVKGCKISPAVNDSPKMRVMEAENLREREITLREYDEEREKLLKLIIFPN